MTATNSCVTISGNKPYFTIDYEQVMSIKTILIIAPNTADEWENIKGVKVYAHNEEFKHDYMCFNFLDNSGYYNC